jgi:hypothetical protein
LIPLSSSPLSFKLNGVTPLAFAISRLRLAE